MHQRYEAPRQRGKGDVLPCRRVDEWKHEKRLIIADATEEDARRDLLLGCCPKQKDSEERVGAVDHEKAQLNFAKALGIRRAELGEDHPDTKRTLDALSRLLKKAVLLERADGNGEDERTTSDEPTNP